MPELSDSIASNVVIYSILSIHRETIRVDSGVSMMESGVEEG